ncbi:MAG: hypothetical protein ABH860_03985, partial [bacterium]
MNVNGINNILRFTRYISNACQDVSDHIYSNTVKRYAKEDKNRNGIEDKDQLEALQNESWERDSKGNPKNYESSLSVKPWYIEWPGKAVFYPLTAATYTVSRLIPDSVSRLAYQPEGTKVINIGSNGAENKLVKEDHFGVELITDMTNLMKEMGILPKGVLGNISSSYDSSDYELGGQKAGKDTKLSFNGQFIDTDKNILDDIFPPISSENKLYKGKSWYKWPGETLRAACRWPSFLNTKARDLKGFWEIPGVMASIPLTALKFVIEDVPNSLLGANISYSSIADTERSDPSFYDPSVKAQDLNVDLCWSLGQALFLTTSIDGKWGTKEYMKGLPHTFADYDVAGRIDAPNLLGKDWGIPFFKLYPWISYKRGAELLGVASGPSIAEIVGALKNEKPIEYSTVSGGVSAELDILSEKFDLKAEFSKESSQMQRSRSVS